MNAERMIAERIKELMVAIPTDPDVVLSAIIAHCVELKRALKD